LKKWEELELNASELTYVPVFERSDELFRLFQNMGVKKKGDFLIENRSKDYELATTLVERERVEKQAPNAGLVKIWNSQIKLLLEICEEGLKTIEKRQDADQTFMDKHLFVAREHRDHVAASLTTTTNDLLNLKLEVQKTRYMYESIAEGTSGAG